jgi:NADH-quinone oxidoreductase subunit L
MPVTYWTYLVGSLALAGVIPFAGFWSKDEILADSIVVGFDDGKISGYMALGFLFVAAGFTAFYIWRQVSLVFFGKPRTAAAEHAPESVRAMTIPLVILAIGSALIGLMNIPDGFPILGSIVGKHRFTEWLEHSVIHAHAGSFNWGMAILATGLAVIAIYAARVVYSDRVLNDIEDKDPLELSPQTAPIFALSNARLYWDESYFRFIIYPFQRAARFLANTVDWRFWHDFVHERILFQGFQGASDMLSKPVDRQIIDGGFMSLAYGVRRFAGRLRLTQTGYVRSYALSVVFGAFLVIVIILFPVLRDLLGI